ncbi:hypothetical protein [Nocardia farcinica]|uniref:hypothetical protein n=1 Tax=Nocardia farcinica TaxID=37329 RepID=UPI0037992ECC
MVARLDIVKAALAGMGQPVLAWGVDGHQRSAENNARNEINAGRTAGMDTYGHRRPRQPKFKRTPQAAASPANPDHAPFTTRFPPEQWN